MNVEADAVSKKERQRKKGKTPERHQQRDKETRQRSKESDGRR